MKFTLATIAIAAIGVSAVEFNGIATHVSFRQATSARKFDTLGAATQLGDSLLPGMSDECKAVFSPAVAAHMSLFEANEDGYALTAASLAAGCTPALIQDFQTKWSQTEAKCTKDELGTLTSLGTQTEGLCLKVDGEYCMLAVVNGDPDYEDAAANSAANLDKFCEKGKGCSLEMAKLSFVESGVNPAIAEFMMNLNCLKDSNDKYCTTVADVKDSNDEGCTSTCARDYMNSVIAAVDKDKDLYCAPVATDDVELMNSVHQIFGPYCEDGGGAKEQAWLELMCMTNEDGAFCKDSFLKYPDVCPKSPCRDRTNTTALTCSAACAAEMQSIADSGKCCMVEQQAVYKANNFARCELDVYDACGTTFTSSTERCDKAFTKTTPPPTPSTTPPTPSTTPPTPSPTPPTPSPTTDGFISASTQLQASLCSLLLAFAASLTLRV